VIVMGEEKTVKSKLWKIFTNKTFLAVIISFFLGTLFYFATWYIVVGFLCFIAGIIFHAILVFQEEKAKKERDKN